MPFCKNLFEFLVYTGKANFDSCLVLAKTYVSDEVASLKLAGRLLEQRAMAAVQRTMAAEQRAMAAEKTLALMTLTWQKLEEALKDKEKLLILDGLRARGLLSSRGIYQRLLQLVHAENTPILGPFFVATETCRNVGQLSNGTSFPFDVFSEAVRMSSI